MSKTFMSLRQVLYRRSYIHIIFIDISICGYENIHTLSKIFLYHHCHNGGYMLHRNQYYKQVYTIVTWRSRKIDITRAVYVIKSLSPDHPRVTPNNKTLSANRSCAFPKVIRQKSRQVYIQSI